MPSFSTLINNLYGDGCLGLKDFPSTLPFGDVEYLQGTQDHTDTKVRMPGDMDHRGRKGIKQLRFSGANDYVDCVVMLLSMGNF